LKYVRYRATEIQDKQIAELWVSLENWMPHYISVVHGESLVSRL